MISITKAQVPVYLANSDLYNSLSSEDGDEFSIPAAYFKPTPTVTDLEDLSLLLRAMQYWGVTSWPEELLSFCFMDHSIEYQEQVLSLMLEFESLSDAIQVYTMLQAFHSTPVGTSNVTINPNAVLRLLPYLLSKDCLLSEQVAAAVEKLYRKCPDSRNSIFQYVSSNQEKICNICGITKLFSTLCEPLPQFDLLRPLLPLILRFLQERHDKSVTCACGIIRQIFVYCAVDRAQAVAEIGILRELVALMSSDVKSIQSCALRTVESFAAGSHMQRQLLIDHQVLSALLIIVRSPRNYSVVCLVACQIISKFVLDSTDFLQAVIDAELFPFMLAIAHTSEGMLFDDGLPEGKLFYESLKTLCFAARVPHVTLEQLRYLVDIGMLRFLCGLLVDQEDMGVKLLAMQTLQCIHSRTKDCDLILHQQVVDAIRTCGR